MFKWVIYGLIELRSKFAWLMLLRNPNYGPVALFLRNTLSDSTDVVGQCLDNETKEKIFRKILGEVMPIFDSINPLLANREYLCTWVGEMANFGVLILPAPPTEDKTGLRGKPGITGTLTQYIETLFQKDKTLKEIAWNLTIPQSEDLVVLVQAIYWQAWLRTHAANIIRMELNDYNPEKSKDWFLPFIEIMYAFFEEQHRKTLSVDSILANETHDTYAELKYSAFINFVLRGDKNPYYTWLEEMKIGHGIEEFGRK